MARIIGFGFSKKQAGVIFFNAKSGNLKVEKWFMKRIYSIADEYNIIDHNGSTQDLIDMVKMVLSYCFEKKFSDAQRLIDTMIETYTSKFLSTQDRTYVA